MNNNNNHTNNDNTSMNEGRIILTRITIIILIKIIMIIILIITIMKNKYRINDWFQSFTQSLVSYLRLSCFKIFGLYNRNHDIIVLPSQIYFDHTLCEQLERSRFFETFADVLMWAYRAVAH